MKNELKSILLVEDNELLLKGMRYAFEKNGYRCWTAVTAADAIVQLREEIPDIIMSDYEMPGMDGFQFRSYLLNDDLLRDIPFVFYTNFSQEVLMMKGLNLNAIDYIIKSTPLPAIISKLDNILSSIRTEHERTLTELRNAAKHVNAKAIPKSAPNVSGFNIDFWHQPFQNYPGGDFIDFIRIDERFCFAVLGDVMGKKWTAWFFAVSYLSYVRAAIRFSTSGQPSDLKNIMSKINAVVLQDDMLKNILTSMSLLLFDSDTGAIHYTGAGDLPLVHYKAADGSINIIKSAGILLGLMEDGFYDEQIIHTDPGDQVLLFTDGLIDIFSPGGKRTDYHLFIDKMKSYFGKKNTLGQIQEEVLQYINEENQLDDASVIFIERKQPL